MNRWALAILLTAGALGLADSTARAQDKKNTPNYEGRLLRRHEEVSHKARADELRWERARHRAQERIAREEMYDRLGYSPQRPYTPLSAMSFGSFGGPSTVWRSYSTRPFGW
jgi:hypothetical protein